jgi:hypothetical protein
MIFFLLLLFLNLFVYLFMNGLTCVDVVLQLSVYNISVSNEIGDR